MLYSQSSFLHVKFFKGLVMVFKRVSEAGKVTVFVVKCLRIFLESNIYPECVRKLLVSLKQAP